MKTKVLSSLRKWHLIDAQGQILGRLSVKIATLLSGKNKITYTPNIDDGDCVVVINGGGFAVSGKKEKNKYYYRYTGYPGGLRSEALHDLRVRRPEEIIRRAVSGMLPRNRLHDRRLARLFIFKGNEHPYGAQLGGENAQK